MGVTVDKVEDIFSEFALDPSQATNVSNTSPMKNLNTLDDLIPTNNFDPSSNTTKA